MKVYPFEYVKYIVIGGNMRYRVLLEHGVEHKYRTRQEWVKLGAKFVLGYQLRYIYFIDKKYRSKLTVPELPFSKIYEMGAGMYKGEKVSQAEQHAIKTS